MNELLSHLQLSIIHDTMVEIIRKYFYFLHFDLLSCSPLDITTRSNFASRAQRTRISRRHRQSIRASQ